MKEAVILVHGIWLNGMEMWRLRNLLTAADYDCHVFHYSSLRYTPAENAQRLNDFAQTISAPVVHFVCHSYGGLLVLHLFDQQPFQKPGRVVFLGTPVNGSAVARRLNKFMITRLLLGKTTHQGLLGDRPVWLRWRDLGIIAGTVSLGMGMFIGGLDSPNDGTVAVEETYLGGATDFITMPASHFGMLYSTDVAVQVVTFLRAGKFGDELTNMLFDPT